jgi:hypothetical protein
VAKDQVLTYADVELPGGPHRGQLRAEQYVHFRGETWLQDLLGSGAARPTRPEVRAPARRVPA